MTSHDPAQPLRTDESHDRASASSGGSRYGSYLRQRAALFADPFDDVALTTNPALFAQAAWQIATGPIMSPPYVDWDSPRILSVRAHGSDWDGTLLADIGLAVASPAPITDAVGSANGWVHDRAFGQFWEPTEQAQAQRPSVLTTTRLIWPVPAARLHIPDPEFGRHAPSGVPADLLTVEAKAAVVALLEVLNPLLAPVLDAVDPRRR